MKLTQETLIEVGKALFGPHWPTPLADALNVAPRAVERWANGSRPIPETIWLEIADLCRSRGAALQRWANRLTSDEAPNDEHDSAPR